ncbi:MAG: MOSC domain-containing protein [Gammaproteobacteria bacterium]|nr:MOSC domain-containing protein [Gammaproteobacteria bacterium]
MEWVGRVRSLWRYPVKSMRGQVIEQAFVGYAGIYGDRLYAFRSEKRSAVFPWLTGRELRDMLCYVPRFAHPQRALCPPHWQQAREIEPGLSPIDASADDLALRVETPAGALWPVHDERLLRALEQGAGERLSLTRSDKALTDCRPVSIFSLQSATRLGEELGLSMDVRRFRANIVVDLPETGGFAEDAFVGRRLHLGDEAVVAVVERDPRCAMVTLHPETGESNPRILKQIVRQHEGRVGVYGAVINQGVVGSGDDVCLD